MDERIRIAASKLISVQLNDFLNQHTNKLKDTRQRTVCLPKAELACSFVKLTELALRVKQQPPHPTNHLRTGFSGLTGCVYQLVARYS